jgi:succinoglycan biosynthesis transport protein ExoP
VLAKREANLAQRVAGELSRHADGAMGSSTRNAGVLRLLWRRRGLIVVLTALSLLPAILYVSLVTPLYTSTSELLIRKTAGGDSGPQKEATGSLTAGELASQRDLITSTPVLAAALGAPGVRDCSPLRNHHDLIETLKRSLQVTTGEGGLLSVAIASSDPDEGTCVLGAVVQSYTQFLSSLRRNGNTDAFATLQAERNRDQTELAKDSADLLHFGKEHHVGGGGDIAIAGAAELTTLSEVASQAHVDAVQAKEADDDLNRALADDPQRAQRLKWFEESAPSSDRANADDEELIRRELLALKAKQADLEQKFMPGHPSLVRIQGRIDQLNLEHDASIQRRAASAAQRDTDMQAAYNQEQQRVLDQTSLQNEFARRSKVVADLQKMVDDLNQRIGNLDLADNSGTPSATLLNPAKASLEPTSPKRQRILLLAALAGFSFSSLLACYLERGQIRTTGIDATGLNLPVLAELPRLPTDFGPIGRGQQSLADGGPVLADLFNGLRSVVEGAKMRARGTIVMITSPARSDGKSVLASNLAVALAQTRKRVLLIDANLRSPSLAKIFGIGNATGLSTLLEAEVSIPITAIHHTATASLDVIPSGPETRNPSDLLNSQRLIDLLGDLSEQYDYLLIDSPPTVTYTDARIIAASCDITMMIVRSDQLNRRLFELAREGLTTIGANLCGVILNSGLEPERSDDILAGAGRGIRGEDEKIETLAKRRLGNMVVTAAKAIDLVRKPATNDRMSGQPSLPDNTRLRADTSARKAFANRPPPNATSEESARNGSNADEPAKRSS